MTQVIEQLEGSFGLLTAKRLLHEDETQKVLDFMINSTLNSIYT
jgi:hypothetical protein